MAIFSSFPDLTRSCVQYFRYYIVVVQSPLTSQYRVGQSGPGFFLEELDISLELLHNQSDHRVGPDENPNNQESDFHSSFNWFKKYSHRTLVQK